MLHHGLTSGGIANQPLQMFGSTMMDPIALTDQEPQLLPFFTNPLEVGYLEVQFRSHCRQRLHRMVLSYVEDSSPSNLALIS